MIEYTLISEHGGYFNDYTTGYKLTYMEERVKRTLLYYDDNMQNCIDFVTSYYAKNGSTVVINGNRFACDLYIEITENRNKVLKKFQVWNLIKLMTMKCNNKKQYNVELKKLFEYGETK